MSIITVHPYTLKFSNATLECEYSNKRHDEFLRPMELWFTRADVILFLGFILSKYARVRSFSNQEFINDLISGSIVFGHFLLAHSGRYVHSGLLTLAIVKSLRTLLTTFVVARFVLPSVKESSDFFMWISVLLVWQLAIGVGLPMLLRETTLLNLGLTVASGLFGARSTCNVALTHPNLRRRSLSILNGANKLFMTLAGSIHVVETIEESKFGDRLFVMCSHFLGLGYFCALCFLPSLILWSLELKSRRIFAYEQARQGRLRSEDLDFSWTPCVFVVIGKPSFAIPHPKQRFLVLGISSMAAYWALFAGV